MDRDQFVSQVRTRIGFDSPEKALQAIKAVLETMREHMAGREPHHLAAQLPGEIGEFLSPLANADARGERFGLQDFYRRVAAKECVSFDEAARHARLVVAVMTEAVSEGEMRDVRSHFSREYEELFAAPVRD